MSGSSPAHERRTALDRRGGGGALQARLVLRYRQKEGIRSPVWSSCYAHPGPLSLTHVIRAGVAVAGEPDRVLPPRVAAPQLLRLPGLSLGLAPITGLTRMDAALKQLLREAELRLVHPRWLGPDQCSPTLNIPSHAMVIPGRKSFSPIRNRRTIEQRRHTVGH